MRFKKLTMITCAALLCAAASAFAQTATTSPPPPDPAVVDQVYKMIDKNGDGVLQKEEVLAWVKQAYPPGPNGEPAGMMLVQPGAQPPPPPPGETAMMPPPPGPLPTPPPCSDALRTSEQNPQKTNVPCNGKEGNLLFRTVCNADGYDTQAITLPAGRAAGCFGVEAITGGRIAFGIRVEGGATLYHSSSGPIPAGFVVSDTMPSATGKYTIFLDRGASDPGAAVTVRFVDYPK
jgi:hypothetical protein